MGLSTIDWSILIATLSFIVIYGVIKTRGEQNLQSFVKGGSSNWWTVGLSVMATQASAITFMSTPGQAYHDGMSFVQFYFGLPLAMIIICITFIPIYHKLKVYTAYEFLENRFDNRTRVLTASLFLIQRGLAAGITIYAPAIILSTILGWNLNFLNLIIGILVIVYTVSGGTKAVSVTQKQQMFVIMGGMFFAFYMIIQMLPESVGFSKALQIAGANGKMEILDFSFDPKNKYTFWSGITGGLFLALSYFGTDQSQVQRYLAARSMEESRMGLIFNGLLKVPMQFFILLVGVFVFVFYQFNQAPIFFNQATVADLQSSPAKTELAGLQAQYDDIYDAKTELYESSLANLDMARIESLNEQEFEIRDRVKTLISDNIPLAETNDKDYVFISFILKYLPQGLIGLLLAVIFSAAMSSTASELNALASTTTMDIYKRNFRQDKEDQHYVKATKNFTIMWGLIAITFACFGTLAENLIQLVNIIGSVFYGTILGIFLVGFYLRRVGASAILKAAIISQICILVIFWMDIVGYLWLNAIGCLLVVILASIFEGGKSKSDNIQELAE